VPAGAIVFDRDGLHVFVVENGIVHSRKITETRDLGTEVEISDGVKKGDHVVLTPPGRASPCPMRLSSRRRWFAWVRVRRSPAE